MAINIEGGCYCGTVRYEITSVPLASMVCHCQSCRRIAGAPAVAWITVAKDDFRLTQGHPSDLESSIGVRRTFCPSCGTPLTYQSVKYSEEIDVTTCTLDNASAYPPGHHSWVSHDLQWVQFGDGLPRYPQSKSHQSKSQATPQSSLENRDKNE